MKNIKAITFVFCGSFFLLSIQSVHNPKPQAAYAGQNCEIVAITLYDQYIHSEIDNATAFETAFEEYILCLSQN